MFWYIFAFISTCAWNFLPWAKSACSAASNLSLQDLASRALCFAAWFRCFRDPISEVATAALFRDILRCFYGLHLKAVTMTWIKFTVQKHCETPRPDMLGPWAGTVEATSSPVLLWYLKRRWSKQVLFLWLQLWGTVLASAKRLQHSDKDTLQYLAIINTSTQAVVWCPRPVGQWLIFLPKELVTAVNWLWIDWLFGSSKRLWWYVMIIIVLFPFHSLWERPPLGHQVTKRRLGAVHIWQKSAALPLCKTPKFRSIPMMSCHLEIWYTAISNR